jgi:hypothetical protein
VGNAPSNAQWLRKPEIASLLISCNVTSAVDLVAFTDAAGVLHMIGAGPMFSAP